MAGGVTGGGGGLPPDSHVKFGEGTKETEQTKSGAKPQTDVDLKKSQRLTVGPGVLGTLKPGGKPPDLSATVRRGSVPPTPDGGKVQEKSSDTVKHEAVKKEEHKGGGLFATIRKKVGGGSDKVKDKETGQKETEKSEKAQKKEAEKQEKAQKKEKSDLGKTQKAKAPTEPIKNPHLALPVASKMIDFIKENGSKLEGITRLSGSANNAKELTKTMLSDSKEGIKPETDPHDVVSALKSIIQEHRLITGDAKAKYIQAGNNQDPTTAINTLKEVLSSMPPEKKEVLHKMVLLAAEIQNNKATTKLNAETVGIAIGSSLFEPLPEGKDVMAWMGQSRSEAEAGARAFALLVNNPDSFKW